MTGNKLFQPVKIGKVEIKNKIAMAPMGILGLSTMDSCFSPRAVDYYVERAKGGTGLIITGICKIENEIEKGKPGLVPIPTLHPMRFIQSASEMTEKVHAYGSKIFLQLGIGLGRVGNAHMFESQPVGPSPIPNYWDPSVTCRELTTEEVETLVKKAAMSAAIAAQAGFDGVEIHAVHEGYLLDQFTIAMFNKRTDKYGGDLEGRLRLPVEIVQAIKKTVGKDFPVQLRYSIKSYIKDWNQGGLPGEEFEEKGRDLDEGLAAAQILEKAGYDAFNADGGSYDAWYWAHPPMYQEHGCYLSLTDELKKVVQVPVLVAGRMEVPELAEKAVNDNRVDMVVLGRGLLADPYWPKKVIEQKTDDIRPCLGCHSGCMGRMFGGRPISCVVNPACGREREYALKPSYESQQVLIVGAGIAGMEAARVASLRGHKVELFEKSDKFGGHLIEGSVPEFKQDDARLLKWYANQLNKQGVKISFNKEVTPEDISDIGPDTVIIATGSNPVIPNIKGKDNASVATASDILLANKKAGEKVVIIGGGLTGCETALWLAQQGKKVTLVEVLNELMIAGLPVPHANRMMLIDLLKFNNVEVFTGSKVKEIANDRVIIENIDNNEKEIPADTVVIATGLKSDQKVYRELMDKFPNLYLIGDAKQPQNIMAAIWEAYEVANNI